MAGKLSADSIRDELRSVLAMGAQVLARMEHLGEDAARTDAEQTALETVVAFFGRPALAVRNGSFGTPPVGWEVLEQHRADIERTIDATGRIELVGYGMLGTGFLVAEDLVMTNCHVAKEFCRRAADAWVLKLGVVPQVDWLGEHLRDAQAAFPIAGVAALHPVHDLALLRLGTAKGASLCPAPLRLASQGPSDAASRALYCVGYPMKDHTRTPPEVLLRIFSDTFGVKRLQPGELLSLDPAQQQLAHDCSTLGGSSGSPIVDLETHAVLGLHFGGTRQENHAVALWQLAEDPLLRRAGLRFDSP
ncbi:Glutamate synthase [NADPH] large chain [Myxococcus hansupus]|uniref:Glutamate synthase [NADPH] large chain n=1 Tax=Pseudomyxococcus hansupus TaxID=1297742 RepID=A0A0H4WP60_9BACT|nr:Glutamate synthase [NADPH] large chain [Myxococcus hansupus]